MAADNERDSLLVVHGHAGECLADVASCRKRIGVAVRSFGIEIDQSHLDGAEWLGQLAIAAVTLVAEPCVLGPPEHFYRFPYVGSAEAKPERLETHGFERDVTGENEQVGPGNLLTV